MPISWKKVCIEETCDFFVNRAHLISRRQPRSVVIGAYSDFAFQTTMNHGVSQSI